MKLRALQLRSTPITALLVALTVIITGKMPSETEAVKNDKHAVGTDKQAKKRTSKRERMAAIIAQITRAKRERDKKKTYQTEKCMWVI